MSARFKTCGSGQRPRVGARFLRLPGGRVAAYIDALTRGRLAQLRFRVHYSACPADEFGGRGLGAEH